MNERFNKNYTVEDIDSWDLTSFYGSEALRVLSEEGLFLSFEPKNDVLKEFPKIYNNPKYDVWIVTACESTGEYAEKVKWMAKFFPDFPIDKLIPCKEKDTIWADMLIDDGLHNLEPYEYVGEPVVYDMPHNRSTDKYTRVFSMYEVGKYMEQKLIERKTSRTA